MLTAIVKYRTHVPYGWIATTFCDIEFLGSNSKDLEREWYEVKYEKYDEFEEKIKENNASIKILENKIEDFKNKINKPWYRPWYNKEEKNQLKKIETMQYDIYNLNKEIEKFEKSRFFSAYELLTKAKKFLTEKGFILHNCSSSDGECSTYKDVWHLN